MSRNDIDREYKELVLYEAFENNHMPYIVNIAVSLKASMPVDVQIHNLRQMIALYEEFRRVAYLKGSFYERCFTDRWDCSISPYSLGTCYIVKYEQELSRLERDYSKLKENEVLRNEKRQGLDTALFDAVNQSPGILQKDIYALFDPVVKADVQDRLYFWAKEGKIKREKVGSTYKVFTI